MDLLPNFPLYLAALALLVAVLVGMYFYKKVKCIDIEISRLREFKSSITILNEKIDLVQEKMLEYNHKQDISSTLAQVDETVVEEEEDDDGIEELSPTKN